jgi:hypothetical protein
MCPLVQPLILCAAPPTRRTVQPGGRPFEDFWICNGSEPRENRAVLNSSLRIWPTNSFPKDQNCPTVQPPADSNNWLSNWSARLAFSCESSAVSRQSPARSVILESRIEDRRTMSDEVSRLELPQLFRLQISRSSFEIWHCWKSFTRNRFIPERGR